LFFSVLVLLDFLFCSFSLLFAAFWTCKLPFQRYLQHFWVWTSLFPENLQHFGARTVLRLRRLVKRFGARMHRQKRLRTNIACWHLVCLASQILGWKTVQETSQEAVPKVGFQHWGMLKETIGFMMSWCLMMLHD
jgi:hypothetical protein